MREQQLVVVTGGAGFIGSHLVEALLKRDYQVRVVDNLVTGRRANLEHVEGKYEWIQGDLADFAVAKEAMRGAFAVLHQAAIPSVPRSIREPLLSHASGPTTTLIVLEAARLAGAMRVVFAASSSAYGNIEELPKHESMLPAPLSPYAAGKLAGEHYIRVYAQTMGLDGVSLRYFNIFGPRQDPGSPYSGVISLFAQALLSERTPVIYGDGQQTRDFTYVENAVHANMLALEAVQPLGGQVLNVGTAQRVSLTELVTTMNEILGTAIEPQYEPVRVGDVRDSLASLTRIQQVLDYEPRVLFREGLKRTLEWAKTSPLS